MRLLHHLDTHDQNVYGAVLTTFPFSARFFERVILPLLTAKSTGQNNVVFLDRAFYERTLERSSDETRPRRAGRDYYLAPVPTPAQRAFHPKVFFFGGRRYAAAYIGSANLTQQALTRNREVVTYVDCVAPSSEAESDSELEPAMQQRAALLEEIRQFVARLPMLEGAAGIGTIPTERVAAITDAAGWTEAYMAVENRRRWFLHNLDRPILKQLFERLEANDEVPARASLSAPFYGGSMVVPKAFTDRGIETTLWLQNDSTQIDREALEEWLDHPEAAVRVYHDSRYTHGKVLQVETDTTRYTLAGSPNLSAPALLTTGPGNGNGNVEAAILRIQGRAANEGLFATKPFVDAATNITGFTSVDTSSPGREDPDRDPPTVVLSNAEFWQAHGYAKGTLELSATVPAFETPPDVALCVTGPEDADERLGIEPHHIERHADSEDSDAAETGNAAIIMQLSVQNGAESPPLHQGGRVRLKWGGELSQARWLNVYHPTQSEEARAATEDAGATLAPQLLAGLVSDDADEVNRAKDSLNAILSANRSRSTNANEPRAVTQSTEYNDDDEPPGGLRMHDWSPSGSSSHPEKLAQSYYEGWLEEINDWVFEFRTDPEQASKLIGSRLGGINRMNLMSLLVATAANSCGKDIPDEFDQLSRRYTKTVYTQRELRNELRTPVAILLERAALTVSDLDITTQTIQACLTDHVAPNVILASLIAQEHIASSHSDYVQQQSWGFERLLADCYLDNPSLVDALNSEQVEFLCGRIADQLGDIIDVIGSLDTLNRYASSAYRNEQQLKSHIRAALGRSILLSGPSAIRAYHECYRPQGIPDVERVFEQEVELLPRELRRRAEREL